MAALQAFVPAMVYLIVGAFLLKLKPLLIFGFLLGLLMMISIQGQLIYWRDYKNLNLLWQDVTQLLIDIQVSGLLLRL